MRNEAERIEALLGDIASQDYAPIEVIVADGRSTDGSAALARAAAERLGLDLQVVDNPARRTAGGLNRAIDAATGALIVRMDCHARYEPDYVRRCVEVALETGAACVGGPTNATGAGAVQRAVAYAMTSPLGGIGWSRGASERRAVDTVYGGAFVPAAIRAAGLYDETLACNEDEELALRIRAAGGTIVSDPSIRSWYFPRDRLRDVFRQYLRYGYWKPAIMRKHRRVFSLRSLAPSTLVVALCALAAAAPFSRVAAALAVAAGLGYAVAALTSATWIVRRRREPPRLAPLVAAAYAAFHFGYGIGMLGGLVRAAGGHPPVPQQMHADVAPTDERPAATERVAAGVAEGEREQRHRHA
jgi:GT2 family glycosyltransferase